MKKLLLALTISLAISATSYAQDCRATDKCVLFKSVRDMAEMAELHHRGADAFQFVLNELIVSGQVIKLEEGTRIKVVAKSGILCQVFHNGNILYTITEAVNCR